MTTPAPRPPLDMALPGIPAPPRPKALDRAEELQAALEIVGTLGLSDPPGELAADIVDAASSLGGARAHIDGYALARALEQDCGWSPDTGIVEALDGYGTCYRSRLEAKQRDWAEAHDIRPPLPDGTRVRLRRGGKPATGTIGAVHPHGPAQYEVAIDGDPQAGPWG